MVVDDLVHWHRRIVLVVEYVRAQKLPGRLLVTVRRARGCWAAGVGTVMMLLLLLVYGLCLKAWRSHAMVHRGRHGIAATAVGSSLLGLHYY
jgi:hypothetical protein